MSRSTWLSKVPKSLLSLAPAWTSLNGMTQSSRQRRFMGLWESSETRLWTSLLTLNKRKKAKRIRCSTSLIKAWVISLDKRVINRKLQIATKGHALTTRKTSNLTLISRMRSRIISRMLVVSEIKSQGSIKLKRLGSLQPCSKEHQKCSNKL